MNTKLKLLLSAAATLSIASAASAQSSAAQAAPQKAQAEAAQDAAADGEVRKVDVEAGKITIRHGELKNLAMPPMTMVFRVQEASILSKLKAGDKVTFVAEKVNGQFVATKVVVKQ